jgi:syntaxin 1B/2/3
MNSNRYGESRAAYREVQERHEDIKRIERTIAELAQLFNDVCLFCVHYVVGFLTIP